MLSWLLEPLSEESRLKLCLPEPPPLSSLLEPLSESVDSLLDTRADLVPDLPLVVPEPLSELPRLSVELDPDLLTLFAALWLAPAFAESEPAWLPPPSREPTAPVVERTASLAASECVIELVSPLSAEPTELAADEPDGALLDGAELDGAGLDGAGLDGAGLDGPGLGDAAAGAAGLDAGVMDVEVVDAAALGAAVLDAAALDAAVLLAAGTWLVA
ncbi:MAG TPA: hypothetical protein VH141_30195 [Pseudonocardia sp.]|nr:hypothetical protein [Pseudonocardia sp.]